MSSEHPKWLFPRYPLPRKKNRDHFGRGYWYTHTHTNTRARERAHTNTHTHTHEFAPLVVEYTNGNTKRTDGGTRIYDDADRMNRSRHQSPPPARPIYVFNRLSGRREKKRRTRVNFRETENAGRDAHCDGRDRWLTIIEKYIYIFRIKTNREPTTSNVFTTYAKNVRGRNSKQNRRNRRTCRAGGNSRKIRFGIVVAYIIDRVTTQSYFSSRA